MTTSHTNHLNRRQGDTTAPVGATRVEQNACDYESLVKLGTYAIAELFYTPGFTL